MFLKLLFFSFFSYIISIQLSFSQQFSLRISGGLTSSQISGDGIHGFAQFGVLTGADVDYKLNNNWSTSLGLQFNQKGARNYETESVYSAYRLRVNYVEAPIRIYYHFGKIQLSTGGYLGVKTNQKERNSFGAIKPEYKFNVLDIGLLFGVNYEIREKWEVELRFQNSIIPVREHKQKLSYPPALFILGDWHQKIYDQGQYFTSLSLVLKYEI